MNHDLAKRLGLDPAALDGKLGAEILSGARVPDGADPLAMAYAGHQFGNWVPQLGDGRAVLLGEILAPDRVRFDLHLKGSGRTPFSRGGDGKAVLSAVLREYILSEAMAALGIPTTRALAATVTGQAVQREGLQPGAVLARVASSHIRVGTFQYLYARKDHDGLQALLDHIIARQYPKAADSDTPALSVLRMVMQRQADLVANWMQVGFIHGVMNTDNMSLAGETIDFGPCAFLDSYHPTTVFSSIDRQGRYAFANQPGIAHWNLAQLAQCLLPLLPGDQDAAAAKTQAVLDAFTSMFETAYQSRFAAKLGLKDATPACTNLTQALLDMMAEAKADFTLTFSALTEGQETGDFTKFRGLLATQPGTETWLKTWQSQLKTQAPNDAQPLMQNANPVYVPRNHRVEQALAAADQGDLVPFETLLTVLAKPFTKRAEYSGYEAAPKPDEIVHATFCGT